MNKWWKYLVISIAVLFVLQLTLLPWVLIFKNQLSGDGIALGAISIQLTILQTLLAIGGIVLAFLGFWGYRDIKESANAKIQETAEEQLPSVVAKVLAIEPKLKSTDDIPTKNKKVVNKNE